MKDRHLLTPLDIPSRAPAEPTPKVAPAEPTPKVALVEPTPKVALDGQPRRTGPVGPSMAPKTDGAIRDELSNTVLDGRYRLDQPLGRGGMGVVYRAFDTKLNRVVAVKLLSEPGAAHRERFEREVHALSCLAHPNLVQLLDAELGARSYLVMELVEGTTLAAQLANGPLSPEQTARLGAGTASALAYVHAQGIVHRDVKPANVLLDGQGKPYLADFGIARLLGTARLTTTGLALGTPAYLAPEQLLRNEVGPGTDVYALGLVLIECLSGHPAFDGTEAEVLAARLHRDPTVPAGAGANWRDLLASMTAATPSDRVTAAYVAGVLSRGGFAEARSTRPTKSNPTAVLEPDGSQPGRSDGQRSGRRRAYAVAGSAVAVTALVLILVLSGVLTAKPHQTAKLVGPNTASTSPTTLPTSTRPVVRTTAPGAKVGPAPASAGPASAGPASTGPASTVPASTVPASTGPASTGPARTGPPPKPAAARATLTRAGPGQNAPPAQPGAGHSGPGAGPDGQPGHHYGHGPGGRNGHGNGHDSGFGVGNANGDGQGNDS